MLISSSWCSVGTFLYSFISFPFFQEIQIGCLKLQCFLNMVNPCSVSFEDDLDDVYVLCLPSCLVSKCLYMELRLGGRGKFLPFCGDRLQEMSVGHWLMRDLMAVAVLPEGQRSSSDLSRWWSRPAGYKDCFQLFWSVCVSRSGSRSTIRALEEIITSAGTVSAPELGAGEWCKSFMKVPIVPSVRPHILLCWSRSILFRDHLSSPCPRDERERGFQRNVRRLTPLFGKESWEAFLGRWY